jgi:hypothetical protein
VTKPLCFVLMPFNKKPDPAGGADIDFDRIYEAAIKPGIEDADMVPIRADEEQLGGIIHRTMYERLLLCDFAVADLTTGNPNVLYELGIRHAARPRTTLTIYSAHKPLPFDVALLRTQPYELGEHNSFPDDHAQRLRERVADHLRELRAMAQAQDISDSPLFQLVTAWRPEPLSLEAAESFREQCRQHEEVKQRLSSVRVRAGATATKADAAKDLGQIRSEVLAGGTADAAILTGLMTAYRALGDWSGMIDVYGELPDYLQRQVTVRQLLAFAYNRRAEDSGDPQDRDRAVSILKDLEEQQGPTSETSGLLGRIYKSQWAQARKNGQDAAARGYLKAAIGAYVRGFETDWSEVYPGINAVTLLEIQGSESSIEHKDRLLPVVRFAAEQRLRGPAADYWDQATMLEIAVLEHRPGQAQDALDSALPMITETWQPKTTADNLRLIAQARLDHGEETGWLKQIIDQLDAAANAGVG